LYCNPHYHCNKIKEEGKREKEEGSKRRRRRRRVRLIRYF
jgi:hypothetical protein